MEKIVTKKRIAFGLMVGAVSICMIMPTSALAQKIHEEVTTIPGKTLSQAELSSISSAAAHVLRQIANARGAIHDKEQKKAESSLKQALTLIQIIKVCVPTVKVRDHIWVAKKHLDYKSTEDVKIDLIPIDADLTELEDFMPVEPVRKHIQKAKEHLQKGDKQAAKAELKAADAALVYNEVDLPLAATEKQVKAAENFLAQNKLQDADHALQIAEDNVQFTSSAVFAPITQARNSLWRATKDYAAKDYKAVKVDLAETESWLDKAARSSDQSIREEAAGLKHAMKSLNGKIGQAGENSESTLRGLWERSRALAECEVDKISTGWDRIKGGSAVKVALVDAKLHLAYAETAQFVDGKSAEAGSELDKSISYLHQGMKASDKVLKARLEAISKELKEMRTTVGDKGKQVQSNYEKAKMDLRRVIHNL